MLPTDRSEPEAVNPEMITLARESRGLSQSELALRLSVSQSLLSKLEAGTVPVSAPTLVSLCRELDYPERFFTRRDRVCGPSTSEFFHRKRAAVPSRVLERIHAQVNIRRMHVTRMLRAVDMPITIPHLDPDEFDGNVEEVARALRARWQLPRGPVRNVIATIESAGGFVIRMRFDTNKVDALSWWLHGEAPIFVVNDAIPADRERLTLCHELGHLVMHSVARGDMEEQADRFAGAFLMPADDIRGQLRDCDLRSLAALKPVWRVSMGALLKRAEHLGLLPAGRVRYLWMQLSRAGYRTREPAELDFPKEPATLLQELIDTHVGELGYDLHEMSSVLGWHTHEVLANYAIKGHENAPKGRLRRVK